MSSRRLNLSPEFHRLLTTDITEQDVESLCSTLSVSQKIASDRIRFYLYVNLSLIFCFGCMALIKSWRNDTEKAEKWAIPQNPKVNTKKSQKSKKQGSWLHDKIPEDTEWYKAQYKPKKSI